MAVYLPQTQHQAVLALADMPENDFAGLVSALAGATPTFSLDEVAESISARSGISSTVALALVHLALSLSTAVARDGSVETVAAEVAHFASEQIDEDRIWEPLKERIPRLLGAADFLELTRKSFELLWEYQRTFRAARVLTDLRPVFGPSPKSEPAVYVIVHGLSLRCMDGSDSDEIYLALDTKDVRSLQAVLTRALQKEAALRSACEARGLKLIDYSSRELDRVSGGSNE